MPRTVRAAFEEFASRLEPTIVQRADASVKHTGVRDCLAESLSVQKAFLTGSYARSTIIRPPNDIDLFVVLDYSRHGDDFYNSHDGAEEALRVFHYYLKNCYPDTPARKDHPAVHLDFATYGFDVVPAFPRRGGGYVIPNRHASGWVATDPTQHATVTTAMNSQTSNYFVPLVKMFKSWSRSHYEKLSGFHLEMAMVRAWPRATSSLLVPMSTPGPVKYAGVQLAAAALFPALSSWLRYYTPDPAGLSGNIDTYLRADDRALTRQRLDSAANDAQIALRHERREDHFSAINKWRDIFGDPFPAYA